MPEMSEEQFEELTMLLEQLGPVRGQMNSNTQTFFDDQVARHEKYGQRMFISAKQLAWLRSSYEKLVGPLDQLSGVPQSEVTETRTVKRGAGSEPDDMEGDDVPF